MTSRTRMQNPAHSPGTTRISCQFGDLPIRHHFAPWNGLNDVDNVGSKVSRLFHFGLQLGTRLLIATEMLPFELNV